MSESILPEYCSTCGGVVGPRAREKVIALNIVGHRANVCPGHPEPATGTVSPWLREQVLLAIGRASMDTRDGMFDHAQAKEIAEQLIQAIVSERGQRIPEPAQKHDGNLDQYPSSSDLRASVTVQENFFTPHVVEISGGYGDCENCRVLIDPTQAISLRAWLIQESPELERFAKEQTRE